MIKLKLKLRYQTFEIPGYPDYSLHRYGDNDFRVWSKPRKDALGRGCGNCYLTNCLNQGYLNVNLHNNGVKQTIRIHQIVAWIFHKNPDSKPEVDHIDRDRSNNRPENLRWATRKEQIDNQGMRSDNISGTTGIGWNRRDKKWRVQLRVDGRQKNFGDYENLNDAIAKLEKIKSQN